MSSTWERIRIQILWIFRYGCFQKYGKTPQIIHFNRVFHYVHHPFWGKNPYFWKHPYRLPISYFFSAKNPWDFAISSATSDLFFIVPYPNSQTPSHHVQQGSFTRPVLNAGIIYIYIPPVLMEKSPEVLTLNNLLTLPGWRSCAIFVCR